MRSLMTVRRRGGAGDRRSTRRRNGPGELQRAQRRAQPAVRHEDRQPVRAAAHRRRSGAAHRRRQADRRDWARSTRSFSPNTATGWPELRAATAVDCRGTKSAQVAASRGRDRRDRRALCAARRTSSSAGRWASRIMPTACTTCRPSPTWPCCAAWSASRTPGCCRSAATRNVQGIGSVGVTPKLKDAIFERLQSHFGVQAADDAGLDTMACIEAR